ncbi:hypothetical protein P7C70_g1605, partial [Phenoliferia sp. Uapishka_3]
MITFWWLISLLWSSSKADTQDAPALDDHTASVDSTSLELAPVVGPASPEHRPSRLNPRRRRRRRSLKLASELQQELDLIGALIYSRSSKRLGSRNYALLCSQTLSLRPTSTRMSRHQASLDSRAVRVELLTPGQSRRQDHLSGSVSLVVRDDMLGRELIVVVAERLGHDPSEVFLRHSATLRLDLPLHEQGIYNGTLFIATLRLFGGAALHLGRVHSPFGPIPWCELDWDVLVLQVESELAPAGRELNCILTRIERTGLRCGPREEAQAQGTLDPPQDARNAHGHPQEQSQRGEERRAKKRRGEDVPELPRRWARVDRGPKWVAAQNAAGLTSVDFDGDADDSDDDYDDNGLYARKKAPVVPDDDVEEPGCAAIEVPKYIPGTNILVPNIKSVHRTVRKILWAHIDQDAEFEWNVPNPDTCSDCLAEMDWLKGDHVRRPYVYHGKYLIVSYSFQGHDVQCRHCSLIRLKTPEERKESDLRCRRLESAQLTRMALGLLQRNTTLEKERGDGEAETLKEALAHRSHLGTPPQLVAAFILHLAKNGGELSGSALNEYSFNFLDTDELAAGLKILGNLTCPISGRALTLSTHESLYNRPSVDRQDSSLPYFHPQQKLWMVSWGMNILLGDHDAHQREILLDIIERPNTELAKLVVQLHEMIWSELPDNEAEADEAIREHDLLLASAIKEGWSRQRAIASWPDAQQNGCKQGRRKFVEGRPGYKYSRNDNYYLDRRDWDLSVGDFDHDDKEACSTANLAHELVFKPFHLSFGDTCAVTGASGESFPLEVDRITDDTKYCVADCWLIIGPVNKFKSTLPQFRDRPQLLSFIEHHPRLQALFLQEGLKAVSAEILRVELCGGAF